MRFSVMVSKTLFYWIPSGAKLEVEIVDHLHAHNNDGRYKNGSRRATHPVRMELGFCLCQDDTLGNDGEILGPPTFQTVPSRYLLDFHHPAGHAQPLFLH
jgi:hypothetical protein